MTFRRALARERGTVVGGRHAPRLPVAAGLSAGAGQLRTVSTVAVLTALTVLAVTGTMVATVVGSPTGVGSAGVGAHAGVPASTRSTAAVPAAAPRPIRADAAYAVTPHRARLALYRAPAGPVARTLGRPRLTGGPLVLLLAQRLPARGAGEWLRVYLPVRPNGSTGWVRRRDVAVRELPYRLELSLGQHVMRLVRAGASVAVFPVGVGRPSTPTPGGTFFLTELVRLRDPGGPYGPYAFGLSGFSPTLISFAGGDGVVGLHGTNNPASIGRSVSHGCIRMRNPDITRLARLLPIGTPIRVRP